MGHNDKLSVKDSLLTELACTYSAVSCVRLMTCYYVFMAFAMIALQ